MKNKMIEETQIPHAMMNSTPPSWKGSIPSGVNKWKNIAPDITPNAPSEPSKLNIGFLKNSPAKSRREVISSPVPTTYALKIPGGKNRPLKPNVVSLLAPVTP